MSQVFTNNLADALWTQADSGSFVKIAKLVDSALGKVQSADSELMSQLADSESALAEVCAKYKATVEAFAKETDANVDDLLRALPEVAKATDARDIVKAEIAKGTRDARAEAFAKAMTEAGVKVVVRKATSDSAESITGKVYRIAADSATVYYAIDDSGVKVFYGDGMEASPKKPFKVLDSSNMATLGITSMTSLKAFHYQVFGIGKNVLADIKKLTALGRIGALIKANAKLSTTGTGGIAGMSDMEAKSIADWIKA